MLRSLPERCWALLLGICLAFLALRAHAQVEEFEASEELPQLTPPRLERRLEGRPISRIDIVPALPDVWFTPVEVTRIRPGHGFSPAAARAAMQELTDSGKYASVRVEVETLVDSVGLRLVVVPRRLVKRVRIVGGVFGQSETLLAAGFHLPTDVTRQGLRDLESRIVAFYANRGYAHAKVTAFANDTEQPAVVDLALLVEPGAEKILSQVVFDVIPRRTAELEPELSLYAARRGSPADEVRLDQVDRAFARQLEARGWYEASVGHSIEDTESGTRLIVRLHSGPRYRVRFEGLESFDADQLLAHLDLPNVEDRSPHSLERRLRDFYVARGFLDVDVSSEQRADAARNDVDLVFHVNERARVRVVGREFPCLSGPRSADDLRDEIDAFLSESLPGAGLLGPPEPTVVNGSLSPQEVVETRAQPLELNPWGTYSPAVYERALEHLRLLYRSEGYLSAEVGPVSLSRRACDRRSGPFECRPIGERHHGPTRCNGGNAPEPPASCVASSERGARCEPEVLVQIPIKLGPRTYLWDIAFEGNRSLVAKELAEVAGLELERPVSRLSLETARRNIVDRYAEAGFGFVSVDVDLEASQDKTRALARFVIIERERVKVREIIVRGAERTHESLILSRVAFARGDYFRPSLVRATEERLATLGVFASVSVELLDPEIPAREKVVVIGVQERPSQRIDTRAGFSTGEGIRVGVEYGHRNLAERAIELTLGLAGSFLPDPLILDEDVRDNFDRLQQRSGVLSRVERRLTASVGFPEIGLGPLYRMNVQGVDVRDLARDFALTREALIFTLGYRPTTRFSAQVGASFEVNDAEILSEEQGLEEYLQENPFNPALRRLLNVPEGRTFAIAQNTGFTWDRRDNPFGATSGTFVGFNIEHVNGFPAPNNPDSLRSNFLRYTNRIAGYLRLTAGGMALAASFAWGFNQQLTRGSQTYPDRLFFLGGIDSLRGFLQDSLIPEDLAQRILKPVPGEDPLTADEVPIRGGDVMINPRLELRVPLVGALQTAVFADAGNLWFDAARFNPSVLRYAAGTGLRLATPLGPLVADYGFNLDQRPWELFGAFHLTLGLF